MTIQPPRAQRIPSVRELHGHTDVDNYAWMRESDAPDFLTHLAAERAYYEAQTAGLAGLTDELFCEAVARTPEAAEDSVGWTLRGYRYWHRTPAKAENRQLFRATPGQAEPTLLLDENALAALTGYIDVPVAEPSPDDRLLAWLADTSGAPILAGRGRATASISSISCPTS
jgi:oligopeptidase B